MTPSIFVLIVIAAFCHATWNLLTKQAKGGVEFTWLISVVAAILYFPLAAWAYVHSTFELNVWVGACILGSIVLHSIYFVVLQKAYSVGDLSLIYPLARGTGPFLSSLLSIIIFAEHPTVLAVVGMMLIVASVFYISGGNIGQFAAWQGVIFGVGCGLVIAVYTLWDKYAVSHLLIPALVLDWSNNFGRSFVLAPWYSKNGWSKAKILLQTKWKFVLGVAILSPLSYILVLYAMQTTPVIYVAPAREMSILIATYLGTRVLGEQDFKRKLIATFGMILGITALVLG